MRVLFWLSAALTTYAYGGYLLFLVLLARLRPNPVRSEPIFPRVSIVMAAHNEAENLPGKLASLRAQRYPAEHMQIVIASDGSTDGTAELLRGHAGWITPVLLPQAHGKAVALNHAVQAATGEILVFMDARQTVDPMAVSELVARFAERQVGAVSGELHLRTAEGHPSTDGLGVYWKIEKMVRRLESATGSVVGATGALFAIRRELFVSLPAGLLLDDVWTPIHVARAGYRVLFCDAAVAYDRIFEQKGKEFGRKVRTLTGNFQLLQLAPWLLSLANPLLFRLISHKLLRLLVPLLLVLMLGSSAFAPGWMYRLLFALQLVVYGFALLGAAAPAYRRFRPVSLPYTFTMLNAAAAVAFYNFLRGRARWA